jgi:hypothetical protein
LDTIKNLKENITLMLAFSSEILVHRQNKEIIALLRAGKAHLDKKYILTPTNTLISYSDKAFKSLQKGGYLIRDNISALIKKRKRSRESSKAKKRQKIIDTNKRKWEETVEKERKKRKVEEILELVNIQYRIKIETDFVEYSSFHTITGFIRDCPRFQARPRVYQVGEDYCNHQVYDSKVSNVFYKIEPIPKVKVPLVEQKMLGCSVNYHYLHIEPNNSPSLECVYQYLLKRYQPYIKSLSKTLLMDLFEEEDSQTGVSTQQLVHFCEYYKIAVDMEMNIFHQYTHQKRSHRYPSLVYVCANSHLYPIIEQSVRDSIFAISRTNSSKCVVEPTTVVTSTEKPTTVVTSTEKPTTVVTSTEKPTTVVTSTEKPTTVVTSTEKPTTVTKTDAGCRR